MHALPFDFIAAHHPFSEVIGRLRALIAVHARALADVAVEAPNRVTVHTEIKARRISQDRWAFDRFYWSEQRPDAAQPFGVRADTLSYDAKTARPDWYAFPSDPYLTALQNYPGRGVADKRTRLLRYVPLRRVTFRMDDQIAGASIGKFKRRSRFREAYHKLGLVADAVGRSRVPFKVATPLRMVEQQALYFQTMLEGDNAADLIGPTTAPVLLARIGEIHRRMHSLDVPDLPVIANTVWMQRAVEDLDLIGLYFPETAMRLEQLAPLLQRTMPADRDFAFCHGDFVCSQLLLSGEHWSITDFDLACCADPYREVAMFVASLAYDVPDLEQAQSPATGAALGRTYVDGYFGSASKVDAKRLLWHRACAELYYLALMLKKDRYSEGRFDARVTAALDFGDQLAHA